MAFLGSGCPKMLSWGGSCPQECAGAEGNFLGVCSPLPNSHQSPGEFFPSHPGQGGWEGPREACFRNYVSACGLTREARVHA